MQSFLVKEEFEVKNAMKPRVDYSGCLTIWSPTIYNSEAEAEAMGGNP